ncbi:probable small intestine urate exporter [Trichonephila clavata]|uniref:Probable small intestine urate exporter n=1 Tax=Trichonephila clavata TaxID=2740835 RepID=A0A8X6L3T2_TRICU|nr:probable small intestine urate exporter [Trichonephila clavata]
MLGKWIPEHERSFHASFILSGYGIGSFLAVIVSGALCGTNMLGGWPSVFYIGAVSGILWCVICAYFMYETPNIHPRISEEEFSTIVSGIETNKREKVLSIPWKEMAVSVPLWALAIGFFGQFWLLGFFSTVHALYMGTVLKLSVAKNGVLSCLPHLLRAFATCIASYPVDLLLKRRVISVGFVRKGATVINTVISYGAFLGITYVGREVTATTILFVLGGILGEFVTFGVCLACIDIAPNLSGTVSGLLNIVGVFPFFIIPALVGWITNFENTIEQWKKVFYTTILIVLVSTVIFVIFGDLKPQK